MDWTIGIITDGTQDARLEKVCESIILSALLTKHSYNIIICGNTNVKYGTKIPFDESVKVGWITRKKNLIVQESPHENIVLMHDYIAFDEHWFSGWDHFKDNDWDVCMNPIINSDGSRFRDWTRWTPRSISYDDDTQIRNMYVSGSYYCIKKDFALQNPLDEKLGWSEGEDVEWSLRVRDKWNYKCNKYSYVKLLKYKEPHWQ